MEQFTLIMSTGLVGLIMVLTMSALYTVSKSEKYMLDWLLAGFSFFVSSGLASITMYVELPVWLHPPLGNAFYMVGHAAIYSGVSKLLYGKSSPVLLIVIFTISLTGHFIPDLLATVNSRILFFYSFIIALNTATVIALWKHKDSSEGKAYYPLIVVLTLFVIQLVLRGSLLLVGGEALTLFGNEFIQTSGTLAVLSLYFLITISFSVIVFWRKEVKLRLTSITDHLTGWLNRKTLLTMTNNALREAKRNNSSVGFIMLDIDHFKSVNDRYGHAVGDRVIKKISQIAKLQVREYDLAFRLGGEEFLILAKSSDIKQLLEMAERIRMSINQKLIEVDGNCIQVSISAGVSLTSNTCESWEELYEQADKALYTSKNNGRNQVTVFSQESPELAT